MWRKWIYNTSATFDSYTQIGKGKKMSKVGLGNKNFIVQNQHTRMKESVRTITI